MPTVADPRAFAVVLFVALVTICAWLRFNGMIHGWAFAGSILASAVAVLLITNVDRLQELILRRGNSEMRAQFKQLEAEVYAKVEQLQRVAEGVAAIAASSIASENRLSGEDHIERMLRRRDELIKFLTAEDVPLDAAQRIVRPIDLMADWDFRRRISIDALASWSLRPGEQPGEAANAQRAADSAKVDAALELADRMDGLAEAERIIREDLNGRVDFAKVAPHFERFRALLSTGRLPRVGPVGNLSKAPLG